jgi:DNA-binding MarR family transcriptional regulator
VPPSTNETHDLTLSGQLCFSAYSVAHAFTRVYKPLLDALGLTYPQYLVLLALWERDGVTVSQVGRQLHLDASTLTPLLKRMEASGLVRRIRAVHDERQVLVSLTDKGRALKGRAPEVRQEIACAVGLAAEDLEALKVQIDGLRASLDMRCRTTEAARVHQAQGVMG